MKITIEVPDTTAAASVTYVYEENGKMMMHTKMFDTQDIEEHGEVTELAY